MPKGPKLKLEGRCKVASKNQEMLPHQTSKKTAPKESDPHNTHRVKFSSKHQRSKTSAKSQTEVFAQSATL